ncbi:MAG: sulfite exporter TauE/SafE family protein [Planctomycetota bacterium]
MWKQKSRDLLAGVGKAGARSRRIRIWAGAVLLITLTLGVQALWPGLNLLPKEQASLGPGVVLMIFLAALFCEYIDSSLGMGYGTTLTPLLLLAGFAPLQIVPAVLLSEFVTGISASLLHQRDGNVDFLRDRKARGTAILLSVLSIVGAVAAVTLALRIPKFWLSAIIATIILSVGVVILATIRRQLAYRRSHIIVLGAIASFNKGLSGGGYGPLVTGGQVVSGISPKQAVAITSLAEGLTCLVGLTAYLLMGGGLYWWLAVPLTLGATLSVPMGTLTVRKLPDGFMRGSVGVVTCLLGVLAFVKLFF